MTVADPGGNSQQPEGTIVVIGGGQAGGWAAKTLRDRGFRGHVVLVASELHPPHERPPLSKAVLTGAALSEVTHLFKPGQLEALDIEMRLGVQVTAIDRDRREVLLSDGSRLSYSRLLMCCGGRARRLTLPGADLPRVHVLRSIDDAHRIREAIGGARKLAVIGGGWLGLEVAAAARQGSLDTVVIEAMPRLCQRSVPENISAFLTDLHQRHGVQVMLGCAIRGFSAPETGGLRVELHSGGAVEADAAVVAVGLIPNDELAREAGILSDRGIVVDETCRTSDPHIFAAGDVTVTPNRWLGRSVRLESWQNAQDQATAAARAALGESVSYHPLPRFWSEQYDITLQMVGFTEAADRCVVRGEMQSGRFVAHYLSAGRIVAAIAANAPRELRMAQRLIERQVLVGDDLTVLGVADTGGSVGQASTRR